MAKNDQIIKYGQGTSKIARIFEIGHEMANLATLSRINNGFFKLVETLLQIHSYFFSHSIKLRVFPLSAVTVLLHCLPRCLRSTDTCNKPPYRNLRWTFKDLLPCHCYAIKTNDNTIRLLVSQPASAGKRTDMSELQAHHCMKPK